VRRGAIGSNCQKNETEGGTSGASEFGNKKVDESEQSRLAKAGKSTKNKNWDKVMDRTEMWSRN